MAFGGGSGGTMSEINVTPLVDVVLVGYLALFDVWLARLRFRRSTIVVDQLVFAEETGIDRGAGPVTRRLTELFHQLTANEGEQVV